MNNDELEMIRKDMIMVLLKVVKHAGIFQEWLKENQEYPQPESWHKLVKAER
jgi:hypothetical protein